MAAEKSHSIVNVTFDDTHSSNLIKNMVCKDAKFYIPKYVIRKVILKYLKFNMAAVLGQNT